MIISNDTSAVVDVVASESCLRIDFRVNETHVTNNRLQRERLKIELSKIIDSCELGKAEINNVSLTSEIIHDYKRGNFKSVTSPPEFMTDSVYLTLLIGKNCVLLNPLQEWLLGCF